MNKNFFQDPSKPSMNELIRWFQVEYPNLVDDMQDSNHAFTTNEPNPYHLEGSIWTHTMMVCQRAEIENSSKILLITALLHDIGKPKAREILLFNSPKPVYSDSNAIRNKGLNDGKTSGLQDRLKYFQEELNFSDDELVQKYPDEYKEYKEYLEQLETSKSVIEEE